jgi:hypothetical protein
MSGVHILMNSLITVSCLLILLFPVSSHPHEGELDEYGCHYDRQRKNYHCHQGVYKLGSFGSKAQMIRLLRLQFLNLGRPWPYSDIAEEDITSTQAPPQESPKAEPGEVAEGQAKSVNSRKKQASAPDQQKAITQPPKPAASASKRQTVSNPGKETKQQIEPAASKTQPPVTGNKTREIPPIQEWIVRITSDGIVIYENSRHERYYFDQSGKKVDVRR